MMELHLGAAVRFTGLVSVEARHLNGTAGQIVGHDGRTGRWHVRSLETDGTTRACRGENLQLVTPATDQVYFLYDYRPENVGLFFALLPKLGYGDAARAVFACNETAPHEDQVHFIRWALANPRLCHALLVSRAEDEDEVVTGWVEDLALTARQVAWHQERQWLAPTAHVWGRATAEAAIRSFDVLSRRVRALPAHETLPYIFERASSRRTLLLWQPTEFLDNASRCPRPHDQTYAAFRFRETLCEDITYLHQVEKPNEAAGIVIRADQVWAGTVLKAWLQQAAQAHQYPPLDSTEYCAILHGIFSMLGPPGTRAPTDERPSQPRRGEGEANRRGLQRDPGGSRHQDGTTRGPRPGGPRFALQGSKATGAQ